MAEWGDHLVGLPFARAFVGRILATISAASGTARRVGERTADVRSAGERRAGQHDRQAFTPSLALTWLGVVVHVRVNLAELVRPGSSGESVPHVRNGHRTAR